MTIDEIKNLWFKGYAWLKILPFSNSINASRTYFDIYEDLIRDEKWDELLDEVIDGWLFEELPETSYYREFMTGPWERSNQPIAAAVVNGLSAKCGCEESDKARPWFDKRLSNAKAIFVLKHPRDIPAVAIIDDDLCALFFEVA